MTGCSLGDIHRVVYELRKYLKITIARNMISESALWDSRIDDLRHKVRDSAQRGDTTTNIREKINVAEARREQETQTYMSGCMLCESERNARLEDLDLQYREALEELERQWNATQFRPRFNRISSRLIDVRHRALAQMNARDFEEACYLAREMRALEQQESAPTAERMALSYWEAGDSLRKRYDREREQIIQQGCDKIEALRVREKEAIVPVQNRLAKLYTVQTDLTVAPRSAARVTPAVQARSRRQSLRTPPHAPPDAKLKPPPLSRAGGRSQARP
jgi:hypothetical protein